MLDLAPAAWFADNGETADGGGYGSGRAGDGGPGWLALGYLRSCAKFGPRQEVVMKRLRRRRVDAAFHRITRQEPGWDASFPARAMAVGAKI